MRVLSLLMAVVALPAWADLAVDFRESAPKDAFTISNMSGCPLGAMRVVLDMTQSAGELYFDTTDAGDGVEVFQPFEIVAGAQVVTSDIDVLDGDTQIALDVSGLGVDELVRFTIDVDDRLRHSALGQIQVTGAEIQGAVVTVTQDGADHTGVFDNTSAARVRLGACQS